MKELTFAADKFKFLAPQICRLPQSLPSSSFNYVNETMFQVIIFQSVLLQTFNSSHTSLPSNLRTPDNSLLVHMRGGEDTIAAS